MGVTRTGTPEESAQPQDSTQQTRDDAAGALGRPDEAPTTPLLLASTGDRCTNCGATLAPDQRYCVECGERRGSSRFTASSATPAPVKATTDPSGPSGKRHRFSSSSGATIVAGIATLVLAMGVGVLIGRTGNNNSTPAKAAAPTVVTVNGGSGAATTAGTQTATSSTPSSSKHSNSGGSAAKQSPKTEAKKANQAAAASKPTQAAVKKASHAAQSVVGGSGGQSNNTVQQGGSCKAGSAGCSSSGHFTGNFFGP